MIFDTDVLIWALRGNTRAAAAVNAADEREVSVVSYMEILQGARDKSEVKAIQGFLTDLHFRMPPLTENIGHRASIYVEEYALSAGMALADALLAATAVEAHARLLTGNDRHFRVIQELDVKAFRP